MNIINIKITFDTKTTVKNLPNTLLWENYEEHVSSGIKAGKCGSYKVYLKYPMPRDEMDKIIQEFCKRIVVDGNYLIPHDGINGDYVFTIDNLIAEATYCIAVEKIK